MKRITSTLAAVGLLAALLAAPAKADFGLTDLDVTFTDSGGSPAMQAGSHPDALTTALGVNTTIDPDLGEIPVDAIKDLRIEYPAGLVADPGATTRCAAADFIDVGGGKFACPNSAAVGTAQVEVGLDGPNSFTQPVYNLVPPPGVVLKLGFIALGVPVTLEIGLKDAPPYNGVVSLANIPQPVRFYGSEVSIWGNPASPAHDDERGLCINKGSCPAGIAERAFVTMPRSCSGPLTTSFAANSWQNPSLTLRYEVESHDSAVPPNPLGIGGCPKLGFTPRISAQPTSRSAESPTGLDFDLEIDDEGLTNPEGLANSDIKKAVVTLPEGVTINPSQAEGLAVCSEADLAREKPDSEFGAGCPAASKIGTVQVESKLLEGELLEGSLFVAKPYDNLAGDSLIALYMTIKSPERGVGVTLAGRVEPDPVSGRLITTFEDLPQLPFSHFHLHFREGGRSPLITPPRCGTYRTEAVFTPWANPANPLSTTASFEIGAGVNGGPCPRGGAQPFEPQISAGTLNNSAGTHSPFHLRLMRRDGDQDLTRFDATLPPGVVAKLAGVSQCPDAAIAQAKTKTGTQELASPSCPASAKIGRALAGAGVGSQLIYVPGSVYLAGPFGKAPLSVVGIVPAVAGPFDVGTVVTRQALTIDPKSALVTADGSLSDPIPHILAGIPLRVRDIRVYVDRPDFTLNPTSCDPSETTAQLWGGGTNVFAGFDDAPVTREARFQAANCSLLGFKPRLQLRLRGGTARGDHPALTATLRPRPGDANIASASATLPRSEFLDQSHIRTVCTRVQFAAEACPKGAVYGSAEAITPLLDFPLKGPVYLRSSDNQLPDLVADLRGPASLPVRFELVGRTDSIRGAIRNSFDVAPDVPVSKFVLRLQGAKKGLLVNSTDICARPHRAKVPFLAHNGKRAVLRPRLAARCGSRGG
jgi:hypothetical protein